MAGGSTSHLPGQALTKHSADVGMRNCWENLLGGADETGMPAFRNSPLSFELADSGFSLRKRNPVLASHQRYRHFSPNINGNIIMQVV